MQTCLLAVLAVAAVMSAAGALGDVRVESRPGAAEAGHEPLPEGAIAVTAGGNCDKPGATYVLTKDVTAEGSGLFLAKNVTLDLNGYTLTFLAGPYEHMSNGGFEDEFKGWDASAAPGASVVKCGGDWEFTGKLVCQMSPGDEIVSPYVNLPVAGRSYYALCGVLTDYAGLFISVEDESGRPVEYEFHVGDKAFKTCPMQGKSIMDGGFIYAHFRGQPAGKYRMRIKAADKAVIDGVDILPAFDVGVGIVGKTWIYTEHRMVVVDKHMPCFVDYTVDGTADKPLDSIPNAAGSGPITIRNGTIRSGFAGMGTWAVQAVGAVAAVNLENVRVVQAGINANAVFIPHGKVVNCTFEMDTPFLLERHNLNYVPVVVNASRGSEVARCRFIGGQGNLTVTGQDALVHHNLFVDRQRAVNHYALSLASAERAKVYDNTFAPEIGCGINVYCSKDCEIYDNTFEVKTVERNCEFYNGGGTMVGVRVSDYAAKPGAPRGTWGNKVHNNKFHVVARKSGASARRGGRACAIFSSTGAGVNYVSDNEITVEADDPNATGMAVAFYIGASPNAGVYENNKVVSNTTPAYLGVSYGEVGKCIFKGNTFVKSEPAADGFQPFSMGYWEANEVEFRSNNFQNCDFGVKWVEPDPKWKKNTYSLYWTLRVKVVDRDAKPRQGAEVVITDAQGNEVFKGATGDDGTAQAELMQYSATVTRPEGKLEVTTDSRLPYTVSVPGEKLRVDLLDNMTVTLVAH